MAFIIKFGSIIAALVACVSCMICSGTGIGFIRDKINESDNEKKMKSEKASTIAFCAIMVVAWIVHKVLKMLFG